MAGSVMDTGCQDKKKKGLAFFIFYAFSGESDGITDRILHPSIIILL